MDKCNVALYGCGTVGEAVARILLNKEHSLAGCTGTDIRLSCIVDRRTDELRKMPFLKGVKVTSDLEEPLEDPEINAVVELIGGTDPAGEIIERALKSGKDVVTANKALLAQKCNDLFTLARSQGRCIGFEASVAGGVPIISALQDCFIAGPVDGLYGIVNGTCNYVLTRMTEAGVSYDEALAEAQEQGYAEADPTLDVEGDDSAHKLAILTRLAFGADVTADEIYYEGINNIQPADLCYAGSLGYKLKLLAIGKKLAEGVELHVWPSLLKKNHPLSGVSGSLNAVCVHSRVLGEITMTGLGAGSYPTAGAVVADIYRIARGVYQSDFNQLPFTASVQSARLVPRMDVKTRYYFRLNCLDRAGVLASVAGVLGQHDISIDSCVQQEQAIQGGGYVPVVFMTHLVKEKNMLSALDEINRLPCIEEGTSVMLRVADL